MSDTKQARRYYVSGIVQGVGFRYYTQDIAEQLMLAGFVRNLRDGRVEVYAVGTAEQLGILRKNLERGPRGASVSQIKEESAAVDSSYSHDFNITYDE